MPFVVKSTSGRDVAIAVAVGVALLAVVLWAILDMGHQVAGSAMLQGTILSKHFQPQPEEQLTVGQGNLSEKNVDGVYTMQVRTPDGHVYTVYVEKPDFESHQVGDTLNFLPPPSRQQ